MACADPIGALLSAGDRHGVKFFLSSDWYGAWDEGALLDPDRMAKRFQMMAELVARYGGLRSFYGWYWPNEACLTPWFSESFVRHVNQGSPAAPGGAPPARGVG
jgi:hypothetical protein